MSTTSDVASWIRLGHMVRCGLPAPFLVLHHPEVLGDLWTKSDGGTSTLPGGVPRRWRIAPRRWRPLLDRPNGEAVALALGSGFCLTLIGGGDDPLGRAGPLPLWATLLDARAALRPEERVLLAGWGAFAGRPLSAGNRVADHALST